MIDTVLLWPDRRLATPAVAVDAVTEVHRAVWDRMIAVMEAMPGVGLAAPQIGVMERLAVVDASAERGQAVRMANPEVLEASDELREHVEASPCLPGVSAQLARPARVVVRFLDTHGQLDRQEFTGLWATSVQHQIDHLDGRLFVDRLSPVRRRMLLKKVQKARGRA